MRSVQIPLPLGSAHLRMTPEEAEAKRRHDLIAGRPRRLEIDSEVIKVGIPKDRVRRIDRVRLMMPATRPEFIRCAVERFFLGNPPVDAAGEPIKEGIGRDYWKIPFGPGSLERLQSFSVSSGKTRQQIINIAIDQLLRHLS